MRIKHEWEIRVHLKDGSVKNLGTFTNLSKVGALRPHHNQQTWDDIEEMAAPKEYTHIIEYRDDEHIYDQYFN